MWKVCFRVISRMHLLCGVSSISKRPRPTLPKIRVLCKGHKFTLLLFVKAVKQKKILSNSTCTSYITSMELPMCQCNAPFSHNCTIPPTNEGNMRLKNNGTELNCLKPVPHIWGKCIQFSSNTAQCEDIVLRHRYSRTERCTRRVKI